MRVGLTAVGGTSLKNVSYSSTGAVSGALPFVRTRKKGFGDWCTVLNIVLSYDDRESLMDQ